MAWTLSSSWWATVASWSRAEMTASKACLQQQHQQQQQQQQYQQ
jgi:hypothetical protein